jgi:hypothetical protein
MEERELTQLLQQLGDRVTPGPAPVRRIVDAGEALRGRRSGRVRALAVAAAAAALIGGGAVAATVIDLPSSGSDASSAAGGAADAAGDEAAPPADAGRDTGEGAAAATVPGVVVTPDVAEPGDTVVVDSRDDQSFGLAWNLERLTGSEWVQQYTLGAAFRGDEPRWWPEGESSAVPAAVVSPPLEFVLPPDVTPGDYRICENGAPADENCAYLTVSD